MGLMDYHARFYSPTMGRFVQADIIIPNPTNSQAWNRYSYVFNNPIMYNDPSGHCPQCIVIPAITIEVIILTVATAVLFEYYITPQFTENRPHNPIPPRNMPPSGQLPKNLTNPQNNPLPGTGNQGQVPPPMNGNDPNALGKFWKWCVTNPVLCLLSGGGVATLGRLADSIAKGMGTENAEQVEEGLQDFLRNLIWGDSNSNSMDIPSDLYELSPYEYEHYGFDPPNPIQIPFDPFELSPYEYENYNSYNPNKYYYYQSSGLSPLKTKTGLIKDLQ